MMDDPDFRAQMMAALSSGGAAELAALQEKLMANEEMEGAIAKMGPSLGASLDLLKRSAIDADAFESATSVLLACVRNLLRHPDEPKYRTLNTRAKAVRERLRDLKGGLLSLEAIGFRADDVVLRARAKRAEQLRARAEAGEVAEEEEEEAFELSISEEACSAAALRRCETLIEAAREEVRRAVALAKQHSLPYALCVALPAIRGVVGGDTALAGALTKLLLQNDEFRRVLDGPAGELALPSVVQMLTSQAGLRGVVDYYYPEAAMPGGHRVVFATTVSEWKAAMADADERPVVAFLGRAADPSSRMLTSVFNRLSVDSTNAAADFVAVSVESADDGMALRVLDEAFVHVSSLPCFLFFDGGLELRRWRLEGANVAELQRRLKRVASGLTQQEIDQGPGEG